MDDTADFYGDSVANTLIREAIQPTDSVTVVTKVGALKNPDGPIPLRPGQKPEQLRRAVEDNLPTLGRERLDVVNLRRLDVGPGLTAEGDQLVDLDDQLAALIALRDAGTIGAIGLSAVDESTLRRALPAGIACVQNAFGVVDRAAEGIAWVPFFPSVLASPASRRPPSSPK